MHNKALSKLILGTVQLGLNYGINNTLGKPSKDDALKLLALAQKHGISSLDTAHEYGDSHKIIGLFHSANPHFDILTKFKLKTENQHLEEFINLALQELKCEQINTYSFHSFKDFYFFDKSTLKKVIDNNKNRVLSWGVSIYSTEEFELAIQSDLISVIQIPFNLLDNYTLKRDLLNKAKEQNKTIHVRSVFLQGLFFRDLNSTHPNLRRLEENISSLHSISRENHLSLHELALLYPFSFEQIDGVLIGCDTAQQLKENINALKQKSLDTNTLEQIHKIHCAHPHLLNPVNW